MANCDFCSAPLVANSQFCRYCGSCNDVDLKGHVEFSVPAESSQYPCPHCLYTLTFIQLNVGNGYRVARCQSCLGIFLERCILERLLEETPSPANSINLQQLRAINLDRFSSYHPVKYIRCPVCLSFMNRSNFAYRSGVIVDICRDHGIWLDAGEILQLIEWKKAGGQILADQELQAQSKSKRPSNLRHNHVEVDTKPYRDWSGLFDVDLLNTVLDLIATWLKS